MVARRGWHSLRRLCGRASVLYSKSIPPAAYRTLGLLHGDFFSVDINQVDGSKVSRDGPDPHRLPR